MQCKMCGRCCSKTAVHEIHVSCEDYERIKATLLCTDEEMTKFVKNEILFTAEKISFCGGYSIKFKEDGSCCWLNDDKKCSIHAFRPKLCREFPNAFMKKCINEGLELTDGMLEVPVKWKIKEEENG